MNDTFITLAAALAMAIGLAGILLPFVPGLTLIWLAALIYGVVVGFGVDGTIAFIVISVLGLTGGTLGFVLPGRAAGHAGASRVSIGVGVVCAVIGFFVIPILGLVIGGVSGIFAAEFLRSRDSSVAWRATRATLVGFGVGAIAQLVSGVCMIVTWLVWIVL